MKKITIQPLFKYSILLNALFNGSKKDDDNYFMSGRYALEYALIELIKSKNEFTTIHLPNLICEEIVTIIENLNIDILYYNINSELKIDIDELEKSMTNKLSVVLVVNYFGFPSQWVELNKIKNRKNCIFIEDNTHSLYSKFNKKDLGTFGDISFNSFRKMLPLLSGSKLSLNSKQLNFNKKTNTRFPDFSELLYSLREIKNIFPKNNLNQTASHSSKYIPPKPIDNFSKTILDNYRFGQKEIREYRFKNYQFWQKYLEDSDLNFFTSQPLSRDICPYVFPCYANSSDIIAKWIKWGVSNNISIISWPKYHMSTIPFLDDDFKKRILCFPVNHQFDLNHVIS